MTTEISASDGSDTRRNVLILRPGALGDILLALPAVERLHRQWPAARFCWVGYPQYLGWLEESPLVDSWRSIDSRLFCPLYSGRPDEALYLFLGKFDFCVAWISDREGLVRSSLRQCFGESFILADPFPRPDSGSHATDHLAATLSLSPLPATSVISGLETLRRRTMRRVADRPMRQAVIHPGSGDWRKCWPLGHFQQVAQALHDTGFRVTWLTGPADTRLEEPLRLFCERQGMSLHTGLPLREIIDILTSADLYLGNDSGVSHMAAAMGVSTYVVFGPTAPAVWAPRGPHVTLFYGGVECSPCPQSMRETCEDRYCMTEISPWTVLEGIMERRRRSAPGGDRGH